MRRPSDFGELLHTALPLAVVALISSFGTFADRFFLGVAILALRWRSGKWGHIHLT